MATTNCISLQAATESVLSNISLYSGEAEITRAFKLDVKNGVNRVTIYGLSPSLRQDTLRVDGLGSASINDVTVSKTPDPRQVQTVPSDPLLRRHLDVENALESARQARKMLAAYLATVNPNDTPITQLESILESYASLTEKADYKVTELKKTLGDIDEDIAKRPAPTSADQTTGRWQVSVLLNSDADAQVRLVLRYVVHGADWTPSYEIRVNTQKQADNITIIYKALIAQSTGENWRDTPLVLETVTPSFGKTPTELHQWPLSVWNPERPAVMPMTGVPMTGIPMAMQQAPVIIQSPSRFSSRSRSRSRSPVRIHPPTTAAMDRPSAIPRADKGSLSATFQVPGLVDIPSDGIQHHVTVASVTLNAKVQWFSSPKFDTKVYLSAKIKNETDYTFVRGKANIFVDGSFVASTSIPSASPHEVFDCPLGSDPAVKITYHPREKRASQTGIVSRSSIHTHTQHITIQNTKAIALDNLKIMENIPISQDEKITVKLISPALPTPAGVPQSTVSGWTVQTLRDVRKKLKVGDQIQAQWEKTDDEDVDDSAIGKDGKLNWVLVIPPQQSVNLVLKFEVAYPSGTIVRGLDL